jgi:YVTN family beta-propeller protein
VKVFRRGMKPELVARIPVGDLPHGLWPSGDGSRMYVALENGGAVEVIDAVTNQVIAEVPTQMPFQPARAPKTSCRSEKPASRRAFTLKREERHFRMQTHRPQ